MIKTASPNWDLYAAFLAVMQHGSLSAAARTLDAAQPTIRKQIDALEAALDCVLFIRSKAGLVPTDAARAAFPMAQAMASAADALARSASGEDREAAGTVRITCSEIVGIEVLPPILASLALAYPALQFEVSPSDETADLLQRDADVAIRMFRPRQSTLVTRRACTIDIGLFAAEDYLARHPAPASFADLATHRLIGADRGRAFLAALQDRGAPLSRKDIGWRTDSGLLQIAALRSGFGIGPCQVPLAAQADPPLRRVLPEVNFEMETWVVMHENLRDVRRVRLVFDALVAGLADYARR